MRKTPNAVKEANRFHGLDIYGGLKKPQRKKLAPALKREVVVVLPDYAFNALRQVDPDTGRRSMSIRDQRRTFESFKDEAQTIVESGVQYDDAIDMIVRKLMELRKQQG